MTPALLITMCSAPSASAAACAAAASAESRSDTSSAAESALPPASADRVKLYVSQGAEQGWESGPLAEALAELAAQPRDSVLAVDLKPRYAYVLVQPGSESAFVSASGRSLRDKPVSIEVARPRKR